MVVRRRPPRRRRSGASSRRPTARAGRWLLLALAAVALFAAGLWLGSSDLRPADLLRGRQEPGGPEGSPGSARAPEGPTPPGTSSRGRPTESSPKAPGTDPEFSVEQTHEPPPITGPPPSGEGAVVALVIDDLGRSLADLDRIRALGVPVTYAVLPFESRTPEVAAELARRGEEILLHLPMEPANGADPGPGALTGAMSPAELAARTRRALEAVPDAVGVNNHMGSMLSSDRPAMEAVLGVLAGRELYYLDSRTSAESVAYAAARALEIPAAERQVFLDPDPRPEAVRFQFRRLLEQARERGSAIAIGHPHADTLAVLSEEVPLARERGYRFVPVSYLLDRSALASR